MDALYAQNAEDGGKRRCILVQLPEPMAGAEAAGWKTIADVTKARIRGAGKRHREADPMFAGDVGFRVFKLDTSNIRAWSPTPNDLERSLLDHLDHLDAGRTESDVLYELLLKLGLDLCVPIEHKTIASKAVHSVGGGVLMACLDKSITAADAEPLALGIVAWHQQQAPAGDTTCVFRDSAFADDVAKSNLAAILEQHGIARVRSL
jgi:adenine-specific DNA-methyltransferase